MKRNLKMNKQTLLKHLNWRMALVANLERLITMTKNLVFSEAVRKYVNFSNM